MAESCITKGLAELKKSVHVYCKDITAQLHVWQYVLAYRKHCDMVWFVICRNNFFHGKGDAEFLAKASGHYLFVKCILYLNDIDSPPKTICDSAWISLHTCSKY